jgi:hypothetical protein
MTYNLLMDITGWGGSVLVVAAYGLISLKKVTADSALYQAFNLIGSICLIAFTAYKDAWPSASVNTIWAVIALISLGQMGVRKWKKMSA